MARAFLIGVFVLAAIAGTIVVVRHDRHPPTSTASSPETGEFYQCSMHPQIVSDRPGTCPICGMALTKVEHTPKGSERRIVGYRHPMRGDVTSPVPATDEMGMAYLPIYADEAAGAPPVVPGHAPFSLTADRQQLIGVTRARIERRSLTRTIRTVGVVAYDPKLYAALVEYREALRSRGTLHLGSTREARDGANGLVRAAALRLRQLGVDERTLGRVLPAQGDPETLLLPGKTAWVYLQVYEFELDLVRPGQRAQLRAPSYPGRSFDAEVVSVDPILDPMTRTARVRAIVATPDVVLRPEAFVDASIDVPLGDVTAVPASAILDTGTQRIAFVVRGAGDFEPRSVTLGRDGEGFYEVLDGLAPGEDVVTSANFLIDSESRFRAALSAFASPDTAHTH
jgi:hypothetical protein